MTRRFGTDSVIGDAARDLTATNWGAIAELPLTAKTVLQQMPLIESQIGTAISRRIIDYKQTDRYYGLTDSQRDAQVAAALDRIAALASEQLVSAAYSASGEVEQGMATVTNLEDYRQSHRPQIDVGEIGYTITAGE